MMKSDTSLNTESTISLVVLASIVIALFAIYNAFEDDFKKIEVNASEIKTQRRDLLEIKLNQKEIHNSLIDVSKSLSRIEGQLDVMEQGRSQ